MEYLVTMTTRVPDRTPDDTVQAMRAREAERSRELAAQGHLLRLWRPPLQPGEWRTLGLFAAADGGRLEAVLTSMPLRAWRTDEVAPLAPHPNDPGDPDHPHTETGDRAMEFLITLTITVPDGTPVQTVADTTAREAVRARALAEQGHLLRLWSLPAQPGSRRTLGLWRAHDPAEMQSILESLPCPPG